jgi:hypothetical protein
MSAEGGNGKRMKIDDSDDDKPLRIKKLMKAAPAPDKKQDTCDDSSEDEPLSERMEKCKERVSSGISFNQMVAQNIVDEGRVEVTIDGTERPVKKAPLTAIQVDQGIHQRNQDAHYRLFGGTPVPKAKSEKEKLRLLSLATQARDDVQDQMGRSASEEGSSDDETWGAVPDSHEMTFHMSEKTIHGEASHKSRVSKSVVRFNPRAGGSDTLASDDTVPGFKIKVTFLTPDLLKDEFIIAWVTWKASDYLIAERTAHGSKFNDGSRHKVHTLYLGWSIHDPTGFLTAFRLILEKKTNTVMNSVTTLNTFKKLVDVHTLVGADLVIYFNSDKEPYPDKFLDIKILEEGEEEKGEEEEAEVPEGGKKKKKRGQDDSDQSDFVPGESSDSSSGIDSNNSDEASVKSCESSSDDASECEEAISDANQKSIPKEVPDPDEGEKSISNADVEGYQQDLPEWDSEEVSDEEGRADKSENEDSS